ncbi:MAG: nuclear transport factor 2 family protein [Xanthobacteraceae bacterium]
MAIGGKVMTERAEIERIIRQAYAARKRNDLEGCLKVFADKPVFRMAGSHVASPIAMVSTGQVELRETLEKLIQAFEWIDHTIVSIVIEGSKAAVHGRVKMESAATGDVVETEVADFIEIRDGRITSFIEFCDTALAGRLMGA